MAPSRIFRNFALGSVAFLSALTLAQAQEATPTSEPASTNQPPLKVDVRRHVEGTFNPYRLAFVTSGAEKFTFLVPEGYRVDTSDPLKVKLASPDFSCLIVLGVSGEFAAGAKMEKEALRTRVLENYRDVVIQSEQTVCANSQTAPALDFTWKADAEVTRMTRTTFIPTAGGLMEFTITASPDKFEASLAELNLVMLTFRSSSNGKFDYVIGSKYP